MEKNNFSVYMCMPSHNGLIHCDAAKAFFINATQNIPVIPAIGASSLLAHGFNNFLADALNKREQYNIKYLAMLHADIRPENWWLDKLVNIAEDYETDLLSVVVPFKDASGLTSTAIAEERRRYGGRRLTLKEVHQLPEIFNIEDVRTCFPNHFVDMPYSLLVNTGCMLINLQSDWFTNLNQQVPFFEIKDELSFDPWTKRWMTFVDSEDWGISKQIDELGGLVMATRAIKVDHLGNGAFPNYQPYGMETDTQA